MKCPVCERGEVDPTTRTCLRCRVAVLPIEVEIAHLRKPRRRQDQNERYGFADYAETKRDHDDRE